MLYQMIVIINSETSVFYDVPKTISYFEERIKIKNFCHKIRFKKILREFSLFFFLFNIGTIWLSHNFIFHKNRIYFVIEK